MTCNCSIEGNGATITGFIEVASSNIKLRNFNLISTQVSNGIYLHGQVGTRYSDITIDGVVITLAATATPEGWRIGTHATYIEQLVIRDCNIL